jgi:DNA-binding MarR family transcriptional regulator
LSDPSDRRAALLHLKSAGLARIRKIRNRRAEVLTSAMLSLSEADRKVLQRALPAMQRLLAELQARDRGKEN